MQLNERDIINLVKGASILTTGGGLCFDEQLLSVERHKNASLSLIDLADIDPDAVIVTASEVGLADAKEMEKSSILPKMFATWEKMTGKRISGVYAAEMGQESILIDTAIGFDVPLVNFDAVGGRAVPFVDINSISVAGIPYSMAPLVAATDQGDIIAVDSEMALSDIEKFLRQLSQLSRSGIAFFIGGAVRAGDIVGSGVDNKSLSLALQLGAASSFEDIKNTLRPQIILSGYIIEKKEISRSGFNCYEALFRDEKGPIYSLFIQNEVLSITDAEGHDLIQPPDKICIVDKTRLSGVSTQDFLSGRPVTLLCVPSDPIWKTPRGLSVFSKNRFV